MKLKYKFYRPFMRFIHKHGFHYAPKQHMPVPHKTKIGLDGKPVIEWYHWCQWCGLRGNTLDLEATKQGADNERS